MGQVDGAGDMLVRVGFGGPAVDHDDGFAVAQGLVNVPRVHFVSQLAPIKIHLIHVHAGSLFPDLLRSEKSRVYTKKAVRRFVAVQPVSASDFQNVALALKGLAVPPCEDCSPAGAKPTQDLWCC